jgi:alpha-L-rhamnosidase
MPGSVTLAKTKRPALFANSAFVWVSNPRSYRNQFVSFSQSVDRPACGPLWLHLFADTRFRLFVNGAFVAYGPGRFVTQFPEFDSFDLWPMLKPGTNHLRVEVNFYGASSYQTMPDGQPGFIAAGQSADGSINFVTPGNWQALAHQAWDSNAPLFSFAQNPAEICDLRLLGAELASGAASPPITLPDHTAPWGTLRPRSAPYPDYHLLKPHTMLVAGPLQNDKQLLCVQSHSPDPTPRIAGQQHPKRSILSWIHSPVRQSVQIDCLWTDIELNGRPLVRHQPNVLGNHEITTLHLQAGWNYLTAVFAVLTEYWSFLLGYPHGSGISWHARPDHHETHPFLVSGLELDPPPPPPRVAPERFTPPPGWSPDSGAVDRVTPARRMAWDCFADRGVVRNLPFQRFDEASTLCGGDVSWSFDFMDQFYGHPVLEVEAPAGTIIDIGYDDWMRDDGAVNLYNSNPFTDSADRFVLPGGRTRIDVCNPRGGRYLQVTARTKDPHSGTATVTIQLVAVRQRTLLSLGGHFLACGDQTMDWVCSTALRTLVASTDESYADCPWRERGSYLGDGYVNIHLHLLLSADARVVQRTLRIFSEAQLANGMLPPVAPAWLRRPHPDFALIWILCLHDYWALTGDLTLANEVWPSVECLWHSSAWSTHDSGLWSEDSGRLFIDWGVLLEERLGPANTTLNLFRFAAAQALSALSAARGSPADAVAFSGQAAAIKTRCENLLWCDQEGRFLPSLDGSTPAVHANILALLFGVGDPHRILAYLVPRLRKNFATGIELGQHAGYVELYFFHYLLPALARHHHHALAEDLIFQHYGFLRNLGFVTLSECFSRAHRKVGSCCHSWSGAPALYFARHILGLRQMKAGNVSDWLVDPVSPTYNAAEGKIAHRDGSIALRWQRVGKRIHVSASAPPSVRLHPADHVDLVMES